MFFSEQRRFVLSIDNTIQITISFYTPLLPYSVTPTFCISAGKWKSSAISSD
jgi:hypothetical protein